MIRFSVKTDGTVYDVQTVEVTEGIQPLAKVWADTIAPVDVCKDQPGR